MTRYLIVGAGPAGLQLAYFLHRAGADYLVLESGEAPGGFFRNFPRHRRLISLNKVHTVADDLETRLRWDWNSLLNDEGLLFGAYSSEYFPGADDLVRYLADFQDRHGLNVRYRQRVASVDRTGTGFVARTEDGLEHEAACLVIATGWGGPNIPSIPGIGLATGYESMPVDGALYDGKRVLILGKGNSAFETAQALIGHAALIHLASPRPVRFAWDSKHPGDVRGMYGALLDSYWFKTLDGVLECEVDRLRYGNGVYTAEISYTLADGEKAELEYDAVLRCTGFTMDGSIFGAECVPERMPNGRIPALRPDWQSANVEGMYFAGTLMQGPDFKKASSAFIDGFRYNLRTLAALLMERYEGTPLPAAELAADAGKLTTFMLDRLNGSSGLWTQFEFLCDVYAMEEGGITHHPELPEEYAVRRFGSRCLTAGLRWGPRDLPDVFAVVRRPMPEHAHESAFIHPVVRSWRDGVLVGERHLLEDLSGRWCDPVRHVEPLRGFLRGELEH